MWEISHRFPDLVSFAPVTRCYATFFATILEVGKRCVTSRINGGERHYSMTHLRLFVPVQRNKVVSGWWLHIQRGVACYGNLKEWKDLQECVIDFSWFQQCFINFYVNSGLKVWWPLNFLLQVQSQKLDSIVIGTQSKAHSWQPISLVLGKWKWNHEWEFPRKSQQCAVIEQRIPNPWTSCHTKAVKRRKQKNMFLSFSPDLSYSLLSRNLEICGNRGSLEPKIV